MPTAVPGAEAPHRRTRTPHALEASLLENQISAPRRRTRPLLALEASLLENRTSRRSNFRAESRQARAPVPFSRPVPAVAAMARHGDPGWRSDRITPLMHEDLWQGGHGPPVQFPARAHHKCSICQHVKSHPVLYLCGHSHCYVCIRLWLERSWSCPECITTMFQPPFRQYAEEAWIADTYPGWDDKSEVNYSWKGLQFPKPSSHVVVPGTV